MNYKYITISQREKIKDKNIAKIVDYIERQTVWEVKKKDAELGVWKKVTEFMFWNISLMFRSDGNVEVAKFSILESGDRDYDDDIMIMNTKIFAENFTGLYASIKNFNKNK